METHKKKGRQQHREVWITLGVGLLGMALILFFSGTLHIQSDSLKGKPAPEIEFSGPDGKPLSITKKKGTAILLNFWASWCEPCMEEMPTLRALENHFGDKGFLLLAFNIEENPEAMRGRISGDRLPRNMIYNFSKASMRPYGVNSIPLSVLIDKKGIIRNIFMGPRNWVDISILREIEEVLKE